MNNLSNIDHQVRRNCDITDARHAGIYSICGLALRLRDLYKWEMGLDPWVEGEASEVLTWIGEKEQQWDEIQEQDYFPIEVNGSCYDPFDTRSINQELAAYNLFYGAGYAHSLKPTFFLGRIKNIQKVNGHTVFTLGRETARDLLTLPALTQDNAIIIREEAAKLFLWDKIVYLKKSSRSALDFAFRDIGIDSRQPQELAGRLPDLLDIQKKIYIQHELGELNEITFPRTTFREIVSAFPHTIVELMARTVKDLLADTNRWGTLAHIIEHRQRAALGLYVAFMDGLSKELFLGLNQAFGKFVQDGNWCTIQESVASGRLTAQRYAKKLISTYRHGQTRNDLPWVENEIKRFLGDSAA
jgi:hypothetical protein